MPEKPTKMRHDTPEKKQVADENTILRVQVGSGLHGISLEGTDDRDEMGICIEPPEYLLGLKPPFEQYEFRTQPMHVRSGHGDLDYSCYSLRKWCKLAAAGNPTVILPLFAPESEVIAIEYPGHELRSMASAFVSRSAGDRYIGYLDRQRDRMLGLLSQRTNRPELVEKYGFDTKFAGHALRLGIQGVELLETGALTLPLPEGARQYILSIRRGEIPKEQVLEAVGCYRTKLVELRESSHLPEHADYDAINMWLNKTYVEWWSW